MRDGMSWDGAGRCGMVALAADTTCSVDWCMAQRLVLQPQAQPTASPGDGKPNLADGKQPTASAADRKPNLADGKPNLADGKQPTASAADRKPNLADGKPSRRQAQPTASRT